MSKHAKFTLVLDGKPISRAEWPKSPRNPFPPALNEMMPWQYVPLVTSQENPLTAVEGWYQVNNAPFDISMEQFLRKQGATDPMIALAYDTIPTYGLDCGRHLGADDGVCFRVHRRAEVGEARDAAGAGRQPEPSAGDGGATGQAVRLNQTVRAIEPSDSGSSADRRRANDIQRRHWFVRCRSATLRTIDLRPALEGAQARAVKTLPYQPIHQVALEVARRSGKRRAGSVDVDRFADRPRLGDLSRSKDDEVSSLRGLGVRPGRASSRPARQGRRGRAYVVVADRTDATGCERRLLQRDGQHSWERDPFAGGAWAYFNPGTVTRFLPAMLQPQGPRAFLRRAHFGLRARHGRRAGVGRARRGSGRRSSSAWADEKGGRPAAARPLHPHPRRSITSSQPSPRRRPCSPAPWRRPALP